MAVARCLGLGLVLGQFPDFARLGDARLLPVHRALAGQFVLRVAQGPVVKLKTLTNADFIRGLSLRNPFIHNLGPSTQSRPLSLIDGRRFRDFPTSQNFTSPNVSRSWIGCSVTALWR